MNHFYSGSNLSASDETNPSPYYVTDVLYQNRQCNQEGFSVLVCGGKDKNRKYSNQVFEVEVPIFKVSKFASMVKPRFRPKLVAVNSDVMVIGSDINMSKDLSKSTKSVEIYSNKTKKCNNRIYK